MNDLVWHYTVGRYARKIEATQLLLPATNGVPEHERPVVWFSARQDFEPTARKLWKQADAVFSLTKVETAELGGGLVRYGLPRESALRWPALCRAAGIRTGQQRRLERAGRRQGADPIDWY